jgi:hypothetical protein
MSTALNIIASCEPAHSSFEACAQCAAPIPELEAGHIRMIMKSLGLRIERLRYYVTRTEQEARAWGVGGAYRRHLKDSRKQSVALNARECDKLVIVREQQLAEHQHNLRLALEALRFFKEQQS